MLAIGCAEFGSATWLIVATKLGFPVPTMQTILGILIGVGFAAEASITWDREKGIVSQIAGQFGRQTNQMAYSCADMLISILGLAPAMAAAFAAILFAKLKDLVLEREDH